jgi:hypothetical protein
VSGKCSGNLATATNLAEAAGNGLFQYACGTDFTVKASSEALSGSTPAEMKTACCTENTCTTKTDAATWKALGVTVDTPAAVKVSLLGTVATAAGWTGSATVTCPAAGAFEVSGVTEVSGKCSGNLATATNLAEAAGDGLFQYACGNGFTVKASTEALSGSTPAEMKAACCTEDVDPTTTTAPVDATTTPKPKDDHKDHDHSPSPATVDAASTMTPASLVTVASILIAYMMH